MFDAEYERRRAETAADDARRAAKNAEEAAYEARIAAKNIKDSEKVIIEEIKNLRADLKESRLREAEYLKMIKELILKTVNLERSLLKQLEKTQQIVINNTNRMIKNSDPESIQMIQKECSHKSEPVIEQLGTTTVYSKISH